MKRRSSGFTVLELVIVIVCVVILGVLVWGLVAAGR
jgi:type II secretory pathway pseudopilin PulG